LNAQKPASEALRLILEKYAQLAMFEGCNIHTPESRDPAGDTPFHMVAYDGDVEAAKIMLPYVSNINFAGDNGDSPLHYAVMNQKLEMAKFLIENGANPRQENDFGDTPIETMGEVAIFQALLGKIKTE
jgi:hypothetical protein